jgi:hypothetical protein
MSVGEKQGRAPELERKTVVELIVEHVSTRKQETSLSQIRDTADAEVNGADVQERKLWIAFQRPKDGGIELQCCLVQQARARSKVNE